MRWAHNRKGQLELAEVVALREQFEAEQDVGMPKGVSRCDMGPDCIYTDPEMQGAWNDYLIAHELARRNPLGHIVSTIREGWQR